MDKKFPILIVEDNENDALILQRALRKAGFDNPFHLSPHGRDAVRYLKGEGPYKDRQKYCFPRILFTDLKMPEMDGFELLQWLRTHPECGIIPAIVLSASQQEKDIARAYRLGANSYFVKPLDSEQLVSMLRLMFEYWKMCEIPEVATNC
jgi:CheY-like chemotaxis protein